MVVGEKLYTVDEFWDEYGGKTGVELVRGIPVKMAPTGETHGIISIWLGHLIMAHVDVHDLGQVYGAETGFRLALDTPIVRAPDVAFVAKTHENRPTSEKFIEGAPNLAVEVVSPNDSASDIQDKVLEFLQAGTSLVWVIYPRSRTIAVYSPEADARILDSDDTLDGGDALLGFSVPVSDVFKKLRD